MPDNYTRVGPGARIFALLLVIVLLILGGGLWLTYLGVIDVRQQLAPVFSFFGVEKQSSAPKIPGITLLDSARLQKEKEALELKQKELQEWENKLKDMQADLESKISEVEEKQKALAEKEKSFNEQVKQYENKEAIVRQSANYLMNMPPANAVEILLNMDSDQDIIDLLWTTDAIAAERGEDSIVPYWLSLMPADKAAELQRKMTKRP